MTKKYVNADLKEYLYFSIWFQCIFN